MANERRNPVPLPPWEQEQVQVGPDFYDPRTSEATPSPLDHEGIPFLTNHEVGNIFGVNPHNSKRVSYRESIPQYKELKGKRDQDQRTWFRLSDVVNHLGYRSGYGKADHEKTQEELNLTGMHKLYSKRLADARTAIAAQKKAGINPGDLFNQPHPGNKDIHARLEFFPYGRPFTVDAPDVPNPSEAPTGLSSNLENPRRHGFSEMVKNPNEGEDLTSLETRPSRLQRRSRK